MLCVGMEGALDGLASLSNNGNSNDAKLKLLERRLTGEVLPSYGHKINLDEDLALRSCTNTVQSRGLGPDLAECQYNQVFSEDGCKRKAYETLDNRPYRKGKSTPRSHSASTSLCGREPQSKTLADPPRNVRTTPNAQHPMVLPETVTSNVDKTHPSQKANSGAHHPAVLSWASPTAAQSDQYGVERSHWEADRIRMERDIEEYRELANNAQKSSAACRVEVEKLQDELTSSKGTIRSLEDQLKMTKDNASNCIKQIRGRLQQEAIQRSCLQQLLSRLKAKDCSSRLGAMTVQQTGALGMREVWEDGYAFKDVNARQSALSKQRDALESARKGLRKRVAPPDGHNGSGASQATVADASAKNGKYLSPNDFVTMDESLKARLTALKRDEDAVNKEKERLEIEMQRHVREMRRLKDEEASRMAVGTTLNDRYILMKLIGKGGFSEVFQAIDLETCTDVAIKVHQLSSTWNSAQKARYVKHSIREYHIQRELKHPRVVSLLDIFEIDSNAFGTVLEFCPGGDLDTYLQAHQNLPEKEARIFINQILAGLEYLTGAPRRIIHYDLKPGNCLFDSLGQVKITDFGLSKVAEEGKTQALELTSQGAGTYWYLPPECFQQGEGNPPTISSKVDVWSVGVIFYQMLYGRRPFGEGCSQERIMREGIIVNAREVAFPTKPVVSVEAKEFITRCLAYRQEDRLTVQEAANHPYLKLRRQKASPG
eukprot:jgi/Botrbrau1/8959/Bobra.0148s0071.2